MNILVTVSEDRKCSASIDGKLVNYHSNNPIWILSFGDLDKPDTDVEVKFTIKQLKELKETIDKSIERFDSFQKELEEKRSKERTLLAEKRKERREGEYHFGSC
jgi:uncharacterized damage-inducible protein DinB